MTSSRISYWQRSRSDEPKKKRSIDMLQVTIMTESSDYPSIDTVRGMIRPSDYEAFRVGWRDGEVHRATDPIASEVIEDLALLLDSSTLVERITPPE